MKHLHTVLTAPRPGRVNTSFCGARTYASACPGHGAHQSTNWLYVSACSGRVSPSPLPVGQSSATNSRLAFSFSCGPSRRLATNHFWTLADARTGELGRYRSGKLLPGRLGRCDFPRAELDDGSQQRDLGRLRCDTQRRGVFNFETQPSEEHRSQAVVLTGDERARECEDLAPATQGHRSEETRRSGNGQLGKRRPCCHRKIREGFLLP